LGGGGDMQDVALPLFRVNKFGNCRPAHAKLDVASVNSVGMSASTIVSKLINRTCASRDKVLPKSACAAPDAKFFADSAATAVANEAVTDVATVVLTATAAAVETAVAVEAATVRAVSTSEGGEDGGNDGGGCTGGDKLRTLGGSRMASTVMPLPSPRVTVDSMLDAAATSVRAAMRACRATAT